MNHREIDALMAGMAPVVRDLVSQMVTDAVEVLLSKFATSAAETIAAEIGRATAALPKPQDGKDADPAVIASMVAEAVAKLPPAQAGKDADPERIAALVRTEAERAVASLPKPENGKDADPALIEQMVSAAVSQLPPAPAGKDADPEQVAALVKTEVERAVAALPKPEKGKDGVGLAGAIIGRDGNLVVTLTDGSQRDLGLVVGKDADRGEIELFISEKVAEIPAPKDGVDGLGFDDMTEELDDDGRTIIRRYSRGDQVKEFRHSMAVVLDRGVWREGPHVKGDGVTFGGSFWIAQMDTTAKPGESDDWRLAVKRGRDGKDAAITSPPAPKPVSFR